MRIEAVLAALQAKKVTLSVVIDPPRGRVMGKILPKINVTPGNIGEPRAGEQQGRFGAQSAAKVAVASGGEAMAPNGVWALEEMITRFHERYLLSYCAEKKHASKPVNIELDEEAKKKLPPFLLSFPKNLL